MICATLSICVTATPMVGQVPDVQALQRYPMPATLDR
jgi:hypothetical protein